MVMRMQRRESGKHGSSQDECFEMGRRIHHDPGDDRRQAMKLSREKDEGRSCRDAVRRIPGGDSEYGEHRFIRRNRRQAKVDERVQKSIGELRTGLSHCWRGRDGALQAVYRVQERGGGGAEEGCVGFGRQSGGRDWRQSGRLVMEAEEIREAEGGMDGRMGRSDGSGRPVTSRHCGQLQPLI
jgi:hypothetical protein